MLELVDVRKAVKAGKHLAINNKSETYEVEHAMSDRQVEMVIAGSLISVIRKKHREWSHLKWSPKQFIRQWLLEKGYGMFFWTLHCSVSHFRIFSKDFNLDKIKRIERSAQSFFDGDRISNSMDRRSNRTGRQSIHMDRYNNSSEDPIWAVPFRLPCFYCHCLQIYLPLKSPPIISVSGGFQIFSLTWNYEFITSGVELSFPKCQRKSSFRSFKIVPYSNSAFPPLSLW